MKNVNSENRILLINLHTSNHGDEAASKAFVRSLDINYKEISLLYNSPCEQGIYNFDLMFKNEVLSQPLSKVDKIAIMLTFFLPIKIVALSFSKALKKEYRLIQDNDIIINMPGGANLGLYNDWHYLWRLYVAIKLKKKVAIFSTSIGPFKENLFKKISKYVLSNVDFLSLRDAQSFRYAEEMQLNYVHSIDTAFLEQPKIENFSLKNYGINFSEENYIVFVPNNLTNWHPTFKTYNPDRLKSLYLNILKTVIEKKLNIVFLPQLFGCGNDSSYFKDIIENLDESMKKHIVIVDENFSSDIQQQIVQKSKFIIGARYHSIIFSINNCKPFICLSYENKMKNMLEILQLENLLVDLTILPKEDKRLLYEKKVEQLMDNILANKTVIKNDEPSLTAKNCFEIFKNDFLLG